MNLFGFISIYLLKSYIPRLNMKRSMYKLISHRNEFVIDKALSQVKKMVNALRMPHITGVTRCKFSSPDVNITAKPRLKVQQGFMLKKHRFKGLKTPECPILMLDLWSLWRGQIVL